MSEAVYITSRFISERELPDVSVLYSRKRLQLFAVNLIQNRPIVLQHLTLFFFFLFLFCSELCGFEPVSQELVRKLINVILPPKAVFPIQSPPLCWKCTQVTEPVPLIRRVANESLLRESPWYNRKTPSYLLVSVVRICSFSVQGGSSDSPSGKTTTGLYAKKFKSYRPVSNLQFISKLLETVVLHQLLNHLLTNNLCDNFQSVYRAHHSTETALLHVMNCLLGSANGGQVSFLTLLDLSAAFDTLDHSILLTRLHDMFGIPGKALEWFLSYLPDRV